VRFLTATNAREADFSCDAWSKLAVNATREEVALGGYVHDIYEAPIAGAFERAVDALLAYQIFAPRRMYAQVCTVDRRVAVGATIVQRVVLGPIAIETAVRVIEVVRDPDRAFFAYATLQGHPERGVASFAVIRTAGETKFEAQAWSRAGSWLTTVGRPVSRALQRALTREAVDSFVKLRGDGAGPPNLPLKG
jgi:uncharacterized protein (UPF0548 family)